MKLHVFSVSYYIQQVFGEGEDKTLGLVLLQPSVNVAAETQEGAVALVGAPDGFERTITGVANGTQDVLVADAAAAGSSEADSLKASLSAQIEENTKLIEANKALDAQGADLSTRLAVVKSANLELSTRLENVEAELAKAMEQLNQKPQPAPAPPVEPTPAPAQPA